MCSFSSNPSFAANSESPLSGLTLFLEAVAVESSIGGLCFALRLPGRCDVDNRRRRARGSSKLTREATARSRDILAEVESTFTVDGRVLCLFVDRLDRSVGSRDPVSCAPSSGVERGFAA
jgi:hypothetical protein